MPICAHSSTTAFPLVPAITQALPFRVSLFLPTLIDWDGCLRFRATDKMSSTVGEVDVVVQVKTGGVEDQNSILLGVILLEWSTGREKARRGEKRRRRAEYIVGGITRL